MEEPKGEEKVGEAEEEYYEAEQQEESWEDDGSWRTKNTGMMNPR